MRAIDTNVIVRLATRDDETQVAAAEKYIAERGAWVSHLVLVEVTWVLDSVYEFERPQIATAIEILLEGLDRCARRSHRLRGGRRRLRLPGEAAEVRPVGVLPRQRGA